jgi:hypothetical protein
MGSIQCNLEFGYQLSVCSDGVDGVGRSQDLPDANLLLAMSPALNTQAPTLVPVCAFAFFSFPFFFLFISLFLFSHKLFPYNYFYVLMVWISTKPHITHVEGIKIYLYL